MDDALAWFHGLPVTAQWSLGLLCVPLTLWLLGAFIIGMADGGGPSFWGKENPHILDYLKGSISVGLFGVVALGMIFGCAMLLLAFSKRLFGPVEWAGTACVIASVVLVLGAIFIFAVVSSKEKEK